MKDVTLIALFAISTLSANIVNIFQTSDIREISTIAKQLEMQMTSLKLTVNLEKKEESPSDLYTHFFCPFCGEAQKIEEGRFDSYRASCFDCKNGYLTLRFKTKTELLENLNKIGVKIFTRKDLENNEQKHTTRTLPLLWLYL